MDEKEQQAKKDKDVQRLEGEIRALKRLIETRIQTFAPVSGTPTISGHIPVIIDGKTYKLAIVS